MLCLTQISQELPAINPCACNGMFRSNLFYFVRGISIYGNLIVLQNIGHSFCIEERASSISWKKGDESQLSSRPDMAHFVSA